MKECEKQVIWSENVVIVDADYVDKVAFNLIVNFERMLNRRIPQADLARWIDCIALDGGIREGDNHIQIVMVHGKHQEALANFRPSNYETELNGTAFKDHLGEFAISAFPTEPLVTQQDFLLDILSIACAQDGVKRIMLVADTPQLLGKIKAMLKSVDEEEKRITLFDMQPLPPGPYRQEILGYSLMNAMGIRSEEFSQAQ
ncbi:MAG: DUF6621 family protein [Prevotella sp.]